MSSEHLQVNTDSWQAFDKVVVASGHYHANRVPDIKGLSEWRKRYPERVMHSKAYRKPQELAGQVSNNTQ